MASSSRPSTYEVFLNFRGNDTRKDYVDVLYEFLDIRGIYTYRDDKNLARGDTIDSGLMNAIKESQIAIVVFSKKYADSAWCLNELKCIMECRKKGQLIVIPIFIEVSTSEVKNLSGVFGEGLSTLKSKYSSDIIDSWEKTIQDAASIGGWEPDNMANGQLGAAMKQIVGVISKTLKPFDSNALENLMGMETRMDDLISKLEMRSADTKARMVGIWGIGGGGKTTLAIAVYKKIYSEFDASCLVENIREQANTRNALEILQYKILSKILGEANVPSVTEGEDLIRSRLCRKKVLIVLDDVNSIGQLEALAGSHDWFGEGSRIIITTRELTLLNAHRVDATYNIRLLNDKDATRLFRRHALRKREHIEDYGETDSLSQQVVRYARGLPLALKVLGLSLCDKDTSEWMGALDRLKKIPADGILEVLRISYDGLKPTKLQELFLDIACFYRNWRKDEAMAILHACDLHPVIGVKELEQKALITTSNGRFDMHDLIQDMGHYIVQGDGPPEKHSRVWRDVDICNMCDRGETMQENQVTLALHAPNYEAPPNLLKVVSSMKNLRSLDVRQNFNGITEEPRFLPRGLQWIVSSMNNPLLLCVQQIFMGVTEEPLFLSHMLRWISWTHYPASSLPTNFQPINLVSLILQNSMLKELWEGSKKFPVLKLLDVSNSKNLTAISDLGGLKNLERLVLSGCSNLTDIHWTIGYLETLVYLNLDGCDRLKMFPPIVRMPKLETLILSSCSHLQKFPEIQQHMVSLKHLNLDHSGIQVLPSSIGSYCQNLVSISLIGCNHLMSFENNFQLFQQRWSISVGGEDN